MNSAPPKTLLPFGIIITSFPGDALLANACLASIKMFMPDVPICIIADGGLDVNRWLRTYNIVKVVTKENASLKFLRDHCFGSRMTSIVSFWESPFEKFLFLDADTIMWGDVMNGIDLGEAQFIHNTPHEPYSTEIYHTQYFNAEEIFKHTRAYNWHSYHYFNSGVFIAQKNLLDLEELKELVMLWKNNRRLFPTDVQGILNLLIFRGAAEGKYKVKEAPLQTVIPVMKREELEKEFVIKNGAPVVKQATVLHWAGRKPWLRYDDVFQTPEYFFRLQHLKNIRHSGRFFPGLTMKVEEYQTIFRHYYKGSFTKLLRAKLKR